MNLATEELRVQLLRQAEEAIVFLGEAVAREVVSEREAIDQRAIVISSQQ